MIVRPLARSAVASCMPQWLDALSPATVAPIENDIKKHMETKFSELTARGSCEEKINEFMTICDHFIQALPGVARLRADFVQWKQEAKSLRQRLEQQALQKDVDGILRLFTQDWKPWLGLAWASTSVKTPPQVSEEIRILQL